MLSAALLAGALALAPAADARRSRKGFGGFDFPTKKPSNNGITVTKSEGFSSAKCTAVAFTFNASAAKSAHVSVISEAWAYACSSDPGDPDWWKKIAVAAAEQSRRKDAKGFAFAKAVAVAATACKSEGNAYGCASAYAYAQAWAEAIAEGTAEAWAEAISECECDNKDQIAAAQADAYAKEVYELTAKVEALASSHVCVKGDDADADFDAQTCLQNIYFSVWAKAIAKAAIVGVCVDKHVFNKDIDYGAYTAAALAEAEVEVDIVDKKGCVYGIDLSYPKDYFKH